MAVHSITRPSSTAAWSLRASVGHGWAMVATMLRARQTRRLLNEMDDRLLADIGVGRGDAAMEASRPMWDTAPTRDQLR